MLYGHTSGVLGLGVDTANGVIASGSFGGNIAIWKVGKDGDMRFASGNDPPPPGTLLHDWGAAVAARRGNVGAAARSNSLAAAERRGTNASNSTRLNPSQILREHVGTVVAVQPVGNLLASCGHDRTVRVCRIDTGDNVLSKFF